MNVRRVVQNSGLRLNFDILKNRGSRYGTFIFSLHVGGVVYLRIFYFVAGSDLVASAGADKASASFG